MQQVDVRDMAMGNASVASMSNYGILKNISFIQFENKTLISCTVSNNFFIKDLSPAFVSFYKSFNDNLAIASTIGRIGNKTFSEQFIETGIAKKLGQKFYASIKIQFYHWIKSDSYYENSNAFIPTIGLFANPLKNFCFGVLIRNPVRVRMNTIEKNKLPAEINPGIFCKVSEKVMLAFSVNQKSNQPLSTQLGLEYVFHSNFFLRFGWQTVPISESFGFGLKMNKLILDIALKTHPLLGNSSSISLTFPL